MAVKYRKPSAFKMLSKGYKVRLFASLAVLLVGAIFVLSGYGLLKDSKNDSCNYDCPKDYASGFIFYGIVFVIVAILLAFAVVRMLIRYSEKVRAAPAGVGSVKKIDADDDEMNFPTQEVLLLMEDETLPGRDRSEVYLTSWRCRHVLSDGEIGVAFANCSKRILDFFVFQ